MGSGNADPAAKRISEYPGVVVGIELVRRLPPQSVPRLGPPGITSVVDMERAPIVYPDSFLFVGPPFVGFAPIVRAVVLCKQSERAEYSSQSAAVLSAGGKTTREDLKADTRSGKPGVLPRFGA